MSKDLQQALIDLRTAAREREEYANIVVDAERVLNDAQTAFQLRVIRAASAERRVLALIEGSSK